MEMSIPIATRIKIKEVKDIEKYARFMEDNGLKINISEIARRLNYMHYRNHSSIPYAKQSLK